MNVKFRIFDKKGQVTMWVIIAISIVVFILLIFVLVKKPYSIQNENFDAQSYIEKCAKDAVNEATDIMIPQGGFLAPKNYKLYKNTAVSYLCLENGYYVPCVSQHPMLLNEMKKEIYSYSYPRIETCFTDLQNELRKRKYSASMTPLVMRVDFGPNRVYLDLNTTMNLVKNGQTQTVNDFDIEVINPIYDLGLVAVEISSQEAKFCYFEYVGYMLLYSRFNINVDTMSDFTKIYTIKDKYTDKQMNIAIRSCAIKPGI